MTHEEMIQEYEKCFANNLSSSAQSRMKELQDEAAKEGLCFKMTNYNQYMTRGFWGKARFDLVPA